MQSDSPLSRYGYHRTLEPRGASPQGAKLLNNRPELQSDYELLLDVDYLMLDATSMRQIRESSFGDQSKVERQIWSIVDQRGKMHNPITNSGGVLVGRIREIGSQFFSVHSKPPGVGSIGEVIIPVASLSTLPLEITKIKSISGDRVSIEGRAIMFACMRISPIPRGFSPELTLTCVDISSLVPQAKRCLEGVVAKRLGNIKDRGTPIHVLVIGCGKAGVTALFCLRELSRVMQRRYPEGPKIQIIAVDSKIENVETVKKMNLADHVARVDATDAHEIYSFVSNLAGQNLCDLVINVVNIPGTEASTVLCTRERRPHGTILWFSMATRFDQAALATDALGKDVTMLIGNGVAEAQVEEILELVNGEPDLRAYLERH